MVNIKGYDFKQVIVRSSYERKSLQYENKIITFLKSVGLSEDDIDEDILDKLQDFYDKLQDEQELLLEQTDESLETNAAGMEIDLSNGDKCTLRLPPEQVNKILSILSFEELQEFVQLIANSVQNPDNNPFCQK